jgi:biopolymer transport protein ExbD
MYPEKIVLLEDEKEIIVPHVNNIWDQSTLKSNLEMWRKKFPEKKDVVLSTQATVTYGQLIKMYDLLVQSDWPEVGINPN